jgi:hypothetical protein
LAQASELTVEVLCFVRTTANMLSVSTRETFTGMKAIVGKDNTNKAIVMAFIGSNDIPTFKQE